MFMKDKVRVFSATRDVREELFPPPLSVLGEKWPGLGLLINHWEIHPTAEPSPAQGSGCRPRHKPALPSTTQHQTPFEQLLRGTGALPGHSGKVQRFATSPKVSDTQTQGP